MPEAKPDIIETTLLRGRVKLLQPRTGFHPAMDTVFLAAAAEIRPGQKLLDAGCGVGSSGLCVTSRIKNISLIGIDINRDVTDIAHQNATLNGVSGSCRFFHGDLRYDKSIPDSAFDTVIMNPPFQSAGTQSPDTDKALAHGEAGSGATLKDWIKYAHTKLKNGGRLALIHRADRLDEILTHLTARRWFGSLIVTPLLPRTGQDAHRVILRARKERYAPLKLQSGIALHEEDGSLTPTARAVLEDGAGIEN